MTPHWAAYLIGKPYKKDGVGPDEFDCLGFAEYVFKKHKGIQLPIVAIREEAGGNETRIREAAKVSGLRPVFDGSHMPDDLMLMENAYGPHIGVVIMTGTKLYLMHAVEGIGVCLFQLSELSLMGYKNIRSWRLA